MGWFTRKTKKKNINTYNNQKNYYPNSNNNRIPVSFLNHKHTPRSPQRQQFFKKFAEEIVSVWAPKPNNPSNHYVERNYETEAASYLRKLYVELNQKNNRSIFNQRLQEFQRDISNIPLSPKAKEIVFSKLKKLKLYNQMLQNNNNNNSSTRRRGSTRTRFSSNESISSLPSFQRLRNNTANYEELVSTPKRRLQGIVVSPKTQSPKEV
jgi:hypothetical protein